MDIFSFLKFGFSYTKTLLRLIHKENSNETIVKSIKMTFSELTWIHSYASVIHIFTLKPGVGMKRAMFFYIL